MALNNVPQSGQTLNDTRNPIRTNFSVINAAFLVDHVEYNLANQGFHNKVTMPVQVAAPAFAAGINGIYNLNNATTTKNELYVHKQQDAGTADIPFTASTLSSSTPGSAASGWTYLPSGIILQWTNSSSNVTPKAVNFPITFPNQVLNVQVTARGASTFYVSSSTTVLTNVADIGGATNTPFFVFAIGY